MPSQPLSIRLPLPVREHLTVVAAAERRSVSGMVRVLVEDALAERDRTHAAETLREMGYTFRGGQ